jgi:hypothetical protein
LERLWLEVYELERQRGLSEDASMDFVNTVASSELWTSVYDIGRQRGFSPELALDLADAVVSSERVQEWLCVYQMARREGLSRGMATQYANSAIPSIEDEPALANLRRRCSLERYLVEG